MRPVDFAVSDEGQAIATLHLLGVPLVAIQADLTPMQREFLMAALPLALRRLNGGEDAPVADDSSLREIALARLHRRR